MDSSILNDIKKVEEYGLCCIPDSVEVESVEFGNESIDIENKNSISIISYRLSEMEKRFNDIELTQTTVIQKLDNIVRLISLIVTPPKTTAKHLLSRGINYSESGTKLPDILTSDICLSPPSQQGSVTTSASDLTLTPLVPTNNSQRSVSNHSFMHKKSQQF